MSDIAFNCESCGKSLVIDSAGAGIEVTCPDCRAVLTVPRVSVVAPDVAKFPIPSIPIAPVSVPPPIHSESTSAPTRGRRRQKRTKATAEFDEFADMPLTERDQAKVRNFWRGYWWPYVAGIISMFVFGWLAGIIIGVVLGLVRAWICDASSKSIRTRQIAVDIQVPVWLSSRQ